MCRYCEQHDYDYGGLGSLKKFKAKLNEMKIAMWLLNCVCASLAALKIALTQTEHIPK